MSDTLRIETSANGVPNIPEFGTVKTEEGFKALLRDELVPRTSRTATQYPAVLLTTGINDPRVDAWQAGKMAARLQAATIERQADPAARRLRRRPRHRLDQEVGLRGARRRLRVPVLAIRREGLPALSCGRVRRQMSTAASDHRTQAARGDIRVALRTAPAAVSAASRAAPCGRAETRPTVSSATRDVAVDRHLVQLVQRLVHPARDQALDQHAAADQPAHQVADRGELAERHERAEVAEAERRQRLAASRARIDFTSIAACWCATCARGGTQRAGLAATAATGTRRSRRTRRRRDRASSAASSRTTSWCARLTSRPSRSRASAAPGCRRPTRSRSAAGSAPLAVCTPSALDVGHALAGAHGDVELAEQLGRGARDRSRQRRQHARRRLEQREADVRAGSR